MALFGKSFDEKVNEALEKVRGQFPGASISATVDDETVTLRGSARDVAEKAAIMSSFNSLVETKNTVNQIALAQKPAAQAAAAQAPQAAVGATPGSGPAAPAANESAPRIHVVEKGDTLSAIAKRYYGSASDYPRIFEANRDQLSDPDKIQVGQKLRIP